jgi:serine/threonine-protein kinase
MVKNWAIPYIVMEFLPGRTLRTAIQNNLLPDLISKLRIALQVARALRHVHQSQITHRDVKPEDVSVDEFGRVKLMDFGISKKADITLTQPGYLLGTPSYMAPEQVLNEPITPAVDIYGFGIMLYELILGKRPYDGESIDAILYKVVCEPLDLEPLRRQGFPGDVRSLIGRCTGKKPTARPHDFGLICTELEDAIVRLSEATIPMASRLPSALLQSVPQLRKPLPCGTRSSRVRLPLC